jgi:hypothetical protein
LEEQVTVEDSSATAMDARLQCQPNSNFARAMLNDLFDQPSQNSQIQGIELPLLGCRLFVYQNTWFADDNHLSMDHLPMDSHLGKEGHHLSVDSHFRAKKWTEAFYWTLYAIECFLRGKTMQNKLRLRWKQNVIDPLMLENTLHSLFSFNGDILEREFLWLERLNGLLAHYGLHQSVNMTPWWHSFRYRPQYLLEQAMLLSGAGLSRQIWNLNGFINSDFYKLNSAAQYHANWLDKQLKQKKLGIYSTVQRTVDDIFFNQ